MASPVGKAGSLFADGHGGTSNGFRRFEDEMNNPFQQQTATERSFDFGNTSRFRASSSRHEPKNPFQQSSHGGGSSCHASPSTPLLGHASTSSFSFGKGSPFSFNCKEPESKDPFQQSTLLGGERFASAGSGQTKAGSSVLGHAPTSPFCFSNGKASPFMFTNENHVVSNPWQQSKVVGGGGLASNNNQTTTDSFSFGRTPTSPFSFGKAPLLNTRNQHEPEKGQSSFGEASPFSHRAKLKNPFQRSMLPGGGSSLSSLNQMEAGSSILGRVPTSFGTPFGQPACSIPDQNPMSPFGPASPKVLPQAFWKSNNSNDNSGTGTRLEGFVHAPTSQGISICDNRGPSPCWKNPSLPSPSSLLRTPFVLSSIPIDSGVQLLKLTNFHTGSVCGCIV